MNNIFAKVRSAYYTLTRLAETDRTSPTSLQPMPTT